jgi:hypothetical protein
LERAKFNDGPWAEFVNTELPKSALIPLATREAKAYGNESFSDDEWMVSLKIM